MRMYGTSLQKLKEEVICKRSRTFNDRRNNGLAKDLGRNKVDMRLREFTDNAMWMRDVK